MENKFCVICQEFITNENINKTQCGHEFHSQCYDEYLKYSKKNECPICRNFLNGKIDEKTTNEIPSNIIHEVIHSDFSNGMLIIHLPTSGFLSPFAQVQIPTDFYNQIIDLTEIHELEDELEELRREREKQIKRQKRKEKRKEKKEKKKNYQKNDSSVRCKF